MPTLDPKYYEGAVADAQSYVDQRREAMENSKSDGPPVAYFDAGTYKLRLWPDIIDDKLVLVRHQWMHAWGKGIGNFACTGLANCPQCKEVDRMDAVDIQDSWRQAGKEIGIVRAFIFEGPESDWIKLQTPSILVMRSSLLYAFEVFRSEIAPGDLQKVLEQENSNFIKIHYEHGRDGNNQVSGDFGTGILPPIPEDFPALADCYITADQYPNDEQMGKIRKFVSGRVAGKTQVLDPETPASSGGGGGQPPVGHQSDASVLGDTTDATAPSQDNADAPPFTPDPPKGQQEQPVAGPAAQPTSAGGAAAGADQCPSDDPELKFGACPVEPHPDCVLCDNQIACMEATNG